MPTTPKQIAASLTELWSPRVIAEVDDSYIKVAKVSGSLAWHSHENEDELFLVLKGHLKIEMEDRTVEIGEGEMFVVPKGVRHNPLAEHEQYGYREDSLVSRSVAPDISTRQVHLRANMLLFADTQQQISALQHLMRAAQSQRKRAF
eukprot:gene30408-37617_t